MNTEVSMDRLSTITSKELQVLNPKLHRELLNFCSGLDRKEYPEATIIANGKTNSLHGFVRVYEKLLKSKKEKSAQKQLKKAEKIILGMSTLKRGGNNPTSSERTRAQWTRYKATDLKITIITAEDLKRDEVKKEFATTKIKADIARGKEILFKGKDGAGAVDAFLDAVKAARDNGLEELEEEAMVMITVADIMVNLSHMKREPDTGFRLIFADILRYYNLDTEEKYLKKALSIATVIIVATTDADYSEFIGRLATACGLDANQMKSCAWLLMNDKNDEAATFATKHGLTEIAAEIKNPANIDMIRLVRDGERPGVLR
jgi:tryptophan 2,3-dioxygenase